MYAVCPTGVDVVSYLPSEVDYSFNSADCSGGWSTYQAVEENVCLPAVASIVTTNATHATSKQYAEPVWNTPDYSCADANLVSTSVQPLSTCVQGSVIYGPGAPALPSSINSGLPLAINISGVAPQPKGYPAVIAVSMQSQ